MSTVLVTGGTGFIGRHLIGHLGRKGYEVIILTRKARENDPRFRYAMWDPGSGMIDEAAVGKADHIIHLAGAGVADKRWTPRRKLEIAESRVQGAALIVKALKEIPNHVSTVVSASATGWYGADTEGSRQHGFREDTPADRHFLGETCRLWEAAISPVQEEGKRLVKLRIGMVLSDDGGAMEKIAKPVKMGIATIFGGGDQVMSWIHIDDLCRMFLFALENQNLSGPYNAVAPQPVTNKAFTLALAQQLRGKFFVPIHVPAFALKLALGEMSIELLKSATVSAEKIRTAGFTYLHPSITAALHLKG